MGNPRSAGSDRRTAAWLAAVAALAYLPFNHCHFSATDELGVFNPALSLYTSGTLAVEPGMHIFAGRDGRFYSHFAIAQTALAVPFIALADAVANAVGPDRVRAAIGRDDDDYIDTHESPPIFAVSAYAPITSGVLVAIFFLFQRGLGASRRSALWAAALLGACTYVATHSVYFLQHTSEAIAIVGGFAALHAWRRTGRVMWLAAGVLLASAVVIVRIPAAVSGPALAGYLAWTLVARARESGLAVTRVAAAIALPSAAVAAVHIAVNYAKWGNWITSPMTAQSFLLHGSLLDGLTGLLLSPGAGVFAYSPLLLLLPLWLPGFWRAHRAEALTVLALTLCFPRPVRPLRVLARAVVGTGSALSVRADPAPAPAAGQLARRAQAALAGMARGCARGARVCDPDRVDQRALAAHRGADGLGERGLRCAPGISVRSAALSDRGIPAIAVRGRCRSLSVVALVRRARTCARARARDCAAGRVGRRARLLRAAPAREHRDERRAARE